MRLHSRVRVLQWGLLQGDPLKLKDAILSGPYQEAIAEQEESFSQI